MNGFDSFQTALVAISDVLSAGVAVITFALLVYSFSFRIRDTVTNSFLVLLLCLTIAFGADAFMTVIDNPGWLQVLIRIHLGGLVFLPASYFLFSDSLLALTGKPSRGKRKLLDILFLFISAFFLLALVTGRMPGDLVLGKSPSPYLQRNVYVDLFTAFFFVVMGLSWFNFIRAYRRTATHISRRRMLYLIASAAGPAIGSFPYLFYGSSFASRFPTIFWMLAIAANSIVVVTLVGMTYAVSFFGYSWADRVIKSRLFRWIMRGPITALITLAVTTLLTRLASQFQFINSAVIALAMVATIVIFEFSVTVFSPIWERLFFSGGEREELQKVRALEDRLLTNSDLSQFLELILSTICDRLQVPGASLIANPDIFEKLEVRSGKVPQIDNGFLVDIFSSLKQNLPASLWVTISGKTVIPLASNASTQNGQLLGIILLSQPVPEMDSERVAVLGKLVDRASLALNDRLDQEKLITSLEMLTPQVSVIQNLLASSRAEQARLLNGNQHIELEDLEIWVKDALSQIWGGPRLLENPILLLSSIQKKIKEDNASPLNAVRDLLRQAIGNLKPSGERQFTNEWLLYNLMELKFLEGWKVKDISQKLALSEADLYRKQRMAITAIARQIIAIEELVS